MALIVLLSAFFVSLAYFSLDVAKKSNYEEEKEYKGASVSSELEIYRDDFGTPIVIAKDEKDAYFGLGFAHAQDRLWQMDLNRRIAYGGLSEIFGDRFVQSDKFFKILAIDNIAKRNFNYLPTETKKILQAYSDGVNFFIQNNLKNLPPEFEKYKFAPKYWQAIDCIALLKLYAFQNSIAFNSELIFGDIAESMGANRALELLPNYPKDAPCVLDSLPYSKVIEKRKQKDSANSALDSIRNIAPVLSSLYNLKNSIGFKNSIFGTNVWAYTNNIGDRKSAVLACDPHSTLSLPALWHQAKISFGKNNIFGATLPGVPAFFVGRNNKIAWGLANANIDDFDFYIEHTDASNQDYYFKSNGEKIKFKLQRDTILVKNSEPVVFDIRKTTKSAIISDADIQNSYLKQNHKNIDISYNRKYALSFEWTATAISDEISSLLKISKSDDWQEFQNAFNSWGAPAVNYVYADSKGNIGSKLCGLYPVRAPRNSFFPYPSWQTNAYWDSIARFDYNLKLYNPPKKFVYAANNSISHNLNIAAHFSAPWRAIRIDELLNSVDYLTARDAQLMQNDSYSKFANEICDLSKQKLWKNFNNMPDNEKNALCYLNVWDYAFNSQSIGAAIFKTFYERLAFNIFEDNLGADVYKKYRSQDYAITLKIYDVIKSNNEYWIDDYRTPQKENIEDIVKRSFSEAVNELYANVSNEIWNWKYSDINKIDLKTFISFDGLMNSSLERNNMISSGSPWTINVTEGLDKEKNSASLKFVVDLNDSVAYSIIPGGASGQALSEHYADQLALYFGGGFLPMPMKSNEKAILKVKIRN